MLGWLFGNKNKETKELSEKAKEKIAQDYHDASARIGDALSYSYMGKPIGFEKMLAKWEKTEKIYADAGFRTISLDRWINYGGWGKTIEDVWMKEREENEEAILHSEIYQKVYNEPSREPDIQKLLDGEAETISGTFYVPSTEAFIENESEKEDE
jgi:hypothetical protein